MKKRTVNISMHVAKMLRALMIGASAKDIRIATGLSKNTITNYVRALRNEGVIYRIGFGKDSRGTTRRHMHIWKLGEGVDVPWNLPDRNTRRRQEHLKRKLEAMAPEDRVNYVPKIKNRKAPTPKVPEATRRTKLLVERVAKSSELAAVMLNLGR